MPRQFGANAALWRVQPGRPRSRRMPIRILLTAAAFAIAAASTAAVAAPSSPPAPVIDLQTGLQCSAAFAIVAAEQDRGVASALAWPRLKERGREFFVHVGALLMDAEHLDRPATQARFKAEVERLQAETMAAPDPAARVAAILTPCLVLLDATVPAP